jgi:predicted nucleic acid-binding Zn ribbon protein
MNYPYKCTNENCKEKDIVKTVSMSMNEYSEDKLPKCESCGNKTNRVFEPTPLKSFEGYRS